MKLRENFKKILLHQFLLTAIILVALAAAPLKAQTKAELDEAAQKVEVLFKQQKFTEALPYAETLVKAYPEAAEVQFIYGFCLLGQSKNTTDKEAVRQLVIKSRQAFVKAKQLGSQEQILDALISSMPEDGDIGGKFSKNEAAETAMNQAEAFFTQGKMDEALAAYQNALKLDPNLYEAALFSGDVYTQKGDFANSEIWYQKAISINPNRETAYRYSATPLMKQKKYEQARDRYVEAFIVEPYSKFSAAGLTQWGQLTNTNLAHPKIDIPADVSKGANGNTTITLGGSGKDDTSFIWLGYGGSRALWQTGKTGLSEKFKKAYPNETVYRHSLAEEYEALSSAARLLKERMNDKNSKIKTLNPSEANLLKLYDDNLLEPYILLAIPDRGIAEDFPVYLKQNREKLRQYVLKYVIGNSSS